jgi:chorismate lyase / 3-hydroxybenzoate synthase
MGLESVLKLDYMSLAELAERPAAWWQGVLGLATFDAPVPAVPAAHVPVVAVQTAVLGANPRRYEVWRCGENARWGERGQIQYRHTTDVVYGRLSILESEVEAAPHAASALQSATERAYREIFALLDALAMPHLVRVWNYLPDIGATSHGSERYWQFNSARQDAFIACGRTVTGAVPAACGVGSQPGTPLVIYFLASSHAPVAIENPRQVSAYHYPAEYSPRSPTFSRACTVELASARALFISGTASIIGHATVHCGDAAAQTRETLRNIEALIREANRAAGPQPPFTLGGLWYKAYVRHAGDLAAIDSELRVGLGSSAQVLYLRADLCRQDLLVEIEATGCHSVNRAS